jgi:hypothetical protein
MNNRCLTVYVIAALALISCATNSGVSSAENSVAQMQPVRSPETAPVTAPSLSTVPDSALTQSSSVKGPFLDEGVESIAKSLLVQIPKGKKVSFIDIETETGKLSDYLIDELSRHLGTGGLTIIDRQNLASVDAELLYQYSTGKVDDKALRSMTSQDAPQYIITGSVKPLGGQYNITLYAVDIEKAYRNTAAARVASDPVLRDLLSEDRSLDALIGQAAANLGRNLSRRYSVKVGRISQLNTDSTTTFSNYLATGISGSAASGSGRLQIVGNNAASEAVLRGNFVKLDNEVEVWLSLVSAEDEFLSSTKFAVPVSELDKRGISAELPPNITAYDYVRKLEAVSLYDSVENEFNLKVTFDRDSALYHDGESMTFTVNADEDCYIKVSHVDVHGNLNVIYPISGRQNNQITAGVPKRIPDTGRFRMVKPYGEEYILIAAYREQFGSETAAAAPVSPAAVSAGLKSRGLLSTDDDQDPVAAAKLSYTIQE